MEDDEIATVDHDDKRGGFGSSQFGRKTWERFEEVMTC
jgi:hypothetical protein